MRIELEGQPAWRKPVSGESLVTLVSWSGGGVAIAVSRNTSRARAAYKARASLGWVFTSSSKVFLRNIAVSKRSRASPCEQVPYPILNSTRGCPNETHANSSYKHQVLRKKHCRFATKRPLATPRTHVPDAEPWFPWARMKCRQALLYDIARRRKQLV